MNLFAYRADHQHTSADARPLRLLTMNQMQIPVNTTHCSTQLTYEHRSLPSYFGTSHAIEEFTWMRASNCHWSVQNLLCHTGFKVRSCQTISITPDGKLWLLHVVATHFRNESTRLTFPLSVAYRIFGTETFTVQWPSAINVSWKDHYCVMYDGRQGHEMWPHCS